MRFVEACDNINFQITEDNEDISDNDLFNSVNSKYYDLPELNQLRPSPSSLGILHTNLASLNKYHEDLLRIYTPIKSYVKTYFIEQYAINN